MNWWQWLLVGLVGLTFWGLMIVLICVANYRFWNFSDPQKSTRSMTCTGCQRHHVRADCPVHGIRA